MIILTNFLHKSLLTDRQVSRLRKTFVNNSSPNIKLLKTKLSKLLQSGAAMPVLDLPKL